jgi:hypothetical protein
MTLIGCKHWSMVQTSKRKQSPRTNERDQSNSKAGLQQSRRNARILDSRLGGHYLHIPTESVATWCANATNSRRPVQIESVFFCYIRMTNCPDTIGANAKSLSNARIHEVTIVTIHNELVFSSIIVNDQDSFGISNRSNTCDSVSSDDAKSTMSRHDTVPLVPSHVHEYTALHPMSSQPTYMRKANAHRHGHSRTVSVPLQAMTAETCNTTPNALIADSPIAIYNEKQKYKLCGNVMTWSQAWFTMQQRLPTHTALVLCDDQGTTEQAACSMAALLVSLSLVAGAQIPRHWTFVHFSEWVRIIMPDLSLAESCDVSMLYTLFLVPSNYPATNDVDKSALSMNVAKVSTCEHKMSHVDSVIQLPLTSPGDTLVDDKSCNLLMCEKYGNISGHAPHAHQTHHVYRPFYCGSFGQVRDSNLRKRATLNLHNECLNVWFKTVATSLPLVSYQSPSVEVLRRFGSRVWRVRDVVIFLSLWIATHGNVATQVPLRWQREAVASSRAQALGHDEGDPLQVNSAVLQIFCSAAPWRPFIGKDVCKLYTGICTEETLGLCERGRIPLVRIDESVNRYHYTRCVYYAFLPTRTVIRQHAIVTNGCTACPMCAQDDDIVVALNHIEATQFNLDWKPPCSTFITLRAAPPTSKFKMNQNKYSVACHDDHVVSQSPAVPSLKFSSLNFSSLRYRPFSTHRRSDILPQTQLTLDSYHERRVSEPCFSQNKSIKQRIISWVQAPLG